MLSGRRRDRRLPILPERITFGDSTAATAQNSSAGSRTDLRPATSGGGAAAPRTTGGPGPVVRAPETIHIFKYKQNTHSLKLVGF